MTVGVCLKCGTLKQRGAWSACPKCRFVPDDDESMTKHLLVTDDFLGDEGVKEVAKKVMAGEEIKFNEEILKKAWINADQVRRKKLGTAYAALFVVLILTAIGLAIWQWMT